MNTNLPYRIFPLGDSALTIDFGNTINEEVNREVFSRFNALKTEPIPGMIDTVPAYSSLTIYYDVTALRKNTPTEITVFEWMKSRIQQFLDQPVDPGSEKARMVEIPVCYDEMFAPDLLSLAEIKNIPVQEVIRLHTLHTYRVYMIGFLPGFAYMGEVEENISMPRKSQPVMVTAGSVGIAGKQTGIYPLASPGGWHIIGRTPLRMFDPQNKDGVVLKGGDTVRFISISKDEFTNY